MIKIFASGSCRLLTTMGDGRGKVRPIHSMSHNFVGINFLAKLHNTQQHIQFIRFLKDEVELPDTIRTRFFTTPDSLIVKHLGNHCDPISTIQEKKDQIRKDWDDCDWYVFEICSLKLYTNQGFQVQYEHTHDFETRVQTEDELLDDLQALVNLIPRGKKILFQVHFRPNVIYNNENMTIEKRETLYRVIKGFCENHENCFMYDPSILLRTNHSFFDGDTHFHADGYRENFHFLFDHYFSIT